MSRHGLSPWRRCCVLRTLLPSPLAIDAVTVVPMTFEQLVEESVAVVYARVADVRGQWTADRRAIDSMVTLEALKYFKGDLGDVGDDAAARRRGRRQ